jgi:hypothetical protein
MLRIWQSVVCEANENEGMKNKIVIFVKSYSDNNFLQKGNPKCY